MADFDAQQAHAHAQAHQNRQDHDQARMDHIERTIARMGDALNKLQQAPPPVQPPPPVRIHYNLNLTPPPPFSGSPLQLPIFKMKLWHFLWVVSCRSPC